MKIRPVEAKLFHADGRMTDMTKLTVALHNFANAPKNFSTGQNLRCVMLFLKTGRFFKDITNIQCNSLTF
jgi:hypothetical protein